MKKKYIVPNIKVVEFEAQTLLAGSSIDISGDKEDIIDDGTLILSKKPKYDVWDFDEEE